MNVSEIIALVLTLTALFGYANFRWLKLPPAIGIMLLALLSSLVLMGLRGAGIDMEMSVGRLLHGINFDKALMQGMLSFLLFAGALQIDVNDIIQERVAIGVLSRSEWCFSPFWPGPGSTGCCRSSASIWDLPPACSLAP